MPTSPMRRAGGLLFAAVLAFWAWSFASAFDLPFPFSTLWGGNRQTPDQLPPEEAPEAPEQPFDISQSPLDKSDIQLLVQRGYRFDAQGRLYAPDSPQPLGKEEPSFILEEIKSRQRLKALMEIDLILSRNNFSKILPKQDMEALRKTARENWGLFSRKAKKELLPYFPAQDLEAMNEHPQIEIPIAPNPPAADQPLNARAPDSQISPAAQAALDALKAANQARQEALAALRAAEQTSPADPARIAALPAPWKSAPQESARALAALPNPWKTPAQTAPGAQLSQPVKDALAKIALARQASLAVQAPPPAAAPGAPPVPPAPILTPPAPQKPQNATVNITYPPFDEAAFRSFLESAPYGHDVKPLLELLAQHGRDPERQIALGLVARFAPQIFLDSQKAAYMSRAAIYRLPGDSSLPGHYLIALNDGPVLVQKHRMLFKDEAYLLPDSPDFYRERGLAIPQLKSFSRQNEADREEDGSWGRLRLYSDGSTRVRYSQEQLAGTLLKQLMSLDAALRGWEADPLDTELRSETAQFRFYRLWAKDTGKEPALDKELAVRLKEWENRPEDYADFLLQSLATPREPVVSQLVAGSAQKRYDMQRRAEVSALQQAGIMGDEAQRVLNLLPAPGAEEPEDKGEIKTFEGHSDAETAWLAEDQNARGDFPAKKAP